MNNLHEVIASYNDYIYNVPKGVIYIAEHLAEGKHDEALVAIQHFSEGMLWLIDVKPLLEEHGMRIVLPIERVQEFLVEINEGLSKKDWVLVADLFAYEISAFFEEQVQEIVQ